MIRHLVVLVAAALRHLVGLEHLLGEAFLPLLLLVQRVGVEARAQFVVSEDTSRQLSFYSLLSKSHKVKSNETKPYFLLTMAQSSV